MYRRKSPSIADGPVEEPQVTEVGGIARKIKEEWMAESSKERASPSNPLPAPVQKSQAEIIADKFVALSQSPEFKNHSASLAKELRAFLIENCKIELSNDPATFVEQIRSGVGFPKTCAILAEAEYVFDSLSRGSLTDSMRKKLNEMS